MGLFCGDWRGYWDLVLEMNFQYILEISAKRMVILTLLRHTTPTKMKVAGAIMALA